MLASRLFRAALLSLGAAGVVRAQDTTVTCACRPAHEHEQSEFERRSAGILTAIQSRPQGALASNIGFGYGLDGAFLFRLDRAGALSLRANAGILGYGDERKQVPLSSTIGGRIQVKVVTTNYIVPLSVGPQLAWPRGVVRPYVNAGVGAQLFYTQSRVQGSDGTDLGFASTTNQSDWTSTWVAGGGVYLPIYRGKTNVLIDAGAQYVAGGRARYLRPGSIQDLPDSQIAITPLESDTHLVLVRLGVRVGGL